MSAILNRQPVIAGQKIGVSPLFAGLLWFVIVGLTMMNIYHIDNFLVSKLTNANSSIFFTSILHVIAVSAALLEVPLAKSIVTNYRLHGFNLNVFTQCLMIVVVVSMAIVGGINSQLSDADKRDSEISSHKSVSGSFESQKRNLELVRDNRKLQVKSIRDKDSRTIETNRADSDYYSALAKLQTGQAAHEVKRPTRAVVTGSWLHWVTIVLFSLLCSLGVVFVSGFMSVYYQSLVSLPAFSLMSKANHEWSSSGKDFVTSKHEISPLNNKMSGFAKVEKAARPSQSENVSELGTANTGAILDDTEGTSDRSLKEGAKLQYGQHHYLEIKRAIVAKEITPAQKPVMRKLISLNVKFADDAARTKKAIEILETLKSETVILDNPKFGNSGGKVVGKFVVNQDYSVQVTSKMIKSACPECSHQSSVSESNLKEWGGLVSCPKCKTEYRPASENITNDNPNHRWLEYIIREGYFVIHEGVFISISPLENTKDSRVIIWNKDRSEEIAEYTYSQPWDYLKANIDTLVDDKEVSFQIEKAKQS